MAVQESGRMCPGTMLFYFKLLLTFSINSFNRERRGTRYLGKEINKGKNT